MADPSHWAKKPRMDSEYWDGAPPPEARPDPGPQGAQPGVGPPPGYFHGFPGQDYPQENPPRMSGQDRPRENLPPPTSAPTSGPNLRGQDYPRGSVAPPTGGQESGGQAYPQNLPPPMGGQEFGGRNHPPPHAASGQDYRGLPPPSRASEFRSSAPFVQLNPADCNIDFDVHPDGLGGSALAAGGFGYCWSGARATLGLLPGIEPPRGMEPVRYCFGCRVTENQPVELPDTPPDQRHLLRVGLSRGDTNVGALGELPSSFGFGGTGKISAAGRFTTFGEPFGVGDTIVCAVEIYWPLAPGGPPPFLPPPSIRIGFSKNNRWLGFAFDTPLQTEDIRANALTHEATYFPHVLLKNVAVRMQFGLGDGLVPPPEGGFLPWDQMPMWEASGSRLVPPPVGVWGAEGPPLVPLESCEVVMMVGVPGSGKTSWAERKAREEAEKRFVILGTDLAIDQMKVPGLTRKRSYAQRFGNLMPRATEIFNTLLERAACVPRNYILDQTNVYFSARRRKLRPFTAFKKVAIVVVCTPEELKHRTVKRTEELGKEVPEEAVNEMKANFALPQLAPHARQSSEGFNEVHFVELPEHEAARIVEEDARAAKESLRLLASSKQQEQQQPQQQQQQQQQQPPPLTSASVSPVHGGAPAGATQYAQHAPPPRFPGGGLLPAPAAAQMAGLLPAPGQAAQYRQQQSRYEQSPILPRQQQSPYEQPPPRPRQQQPPYEQPPIIPRQQQGPYEQPPIIPRQQQGPYEQPPVIPRQQQGPYEQPPIIPRQQQAPYEQPPNLPRQQQSPYEQPILPSPGRSATQRQAQNPQQRQVSGPPAGGPWAPHPESARHEGGHAGGGDYYNEEGQQRYPAQQQEPAPHAGGRGPAQAPPQMPQQHMPQQHMPQQHMPQQHMPQQHMPQQHMPQQHMQQQHMPQQHMPQQHMAQQHMGGGGGVAHAPPHMAHQQQGPPPAQYYGEVPREGYYGGEGGDYDYAGGGGYYGQGGESWGGGGGEPGWVEGRGYADQGQGVGNGGGYAGGQGGVPQQYQDPRAAVGGGSLPQAQQGYGPQDGYGPPQDGYGAPQEGHGPPQGWQ